MTTLKKFLIAVGAILLAAAPPARAQVVSGSFTNDFSGDIEVWDLSGSYDELDGDVTVNYTLNMDPSGKLTGDGTFDFDDGSGDVLHGDLTVNGTVKAAGGVVRVTLTIPISGTGVIDDGSGTLHDVTFTASLKETVEIDSNVNQLIGTGSGKVNVTVLDLNKKRSASIPKSTVQTDLPVDVTGDWTLTLNVVPNGTTYTGDATVETSNGGEFDFTVTGSFSAKNGLSKLALKGSGPNTSTISLLVAPLGNSLGIQGLKGKVLGQSVTGP